MDQPTFSCGRSDEAKQQPFRLGDTRICRGLLCSCPKPGINSPHRVGNIGVDDRDDAGPASASCQEPMFTRMRLTTIVFCHRHVRGVVVRFPPDTREDREVLGPYGRAILF